jgi:hypothetical protein
MRRKPKKRTIGKPKARLGLPDLDQSKAAVIGSLRSPESQRGYPAFCILILVHASPPPIQGGSRMRKRARTVLCGGRSAMVVPTVTT